MGRPAHRARKQNRVVGYDFTRKIYLTRKRELRANVSSVNLLQFSDRPTIIDLCRAGDFPEAQRRLEELGDACANDRDNFALCSAYADLCAVYAYYMKLRADRLARSTVDGSVCGLCGLEPCVCH